MRPLTAFPDLSAPIPGRNFPKKPEKSRPLAQSDLSLVNTMLESFGVAKLGSFDRPLETSHITFWSLIQRSSPEQLGMFFCANSCR